MDNSIPARTINDSHKNDCLDPVEVKKHLQTLKDEEKMIGKKAEKLMIIYPLLRKPEAMAIETIKYMAWKNHVFDTNFEDEEVFELLRLYNKKLIRFSDIFIKNEKFEENVEWLKKKFEKIQGKDHGAKEWLLNINQGQMKVKKIHDECLFQDEEKDAKLRPCKENGPPVDYKSGQDHKIQRKRKGLSIRGNANEKVFKP